eukprot:1147153-Pelagomonas_calceolata.AAC.2
MHRTLAAENRQLSKQHMATQPAIGPPLAPAPHFHYFTLHSCVLPKAQAAALSALPLPSSTQ